MGQNLSSSILVGRSMIVHVPAILQFKKGAIGLTHFAWSASSDSRSEQIAAAKS